MVGEDSAGFDATFENSGSERQRSNNTVPPPSCRRAATLQLEKKLFTSLPLDSDGKVFSVSPLRIKNNVEFTELTYRNVTGVCLKGKKHPFEKSAPITENV